MRLGNACHEAADDAFLFDADDGIIRASHTGIGLISQTVGNTRASAVGTCVCVPIIAVARPIQMPAHGHFFASEFGVKIDEAHGGWLG